LHRVVNLTSVGIDEVTISNHKDAISVKIASYSTHEYEVNDGHDMYDKPTLGINADFNSATEANSFHEWLTNYLTNNSGDFVTARTRVHDCFHASEENLPCEIGDTWELKKNVQDADTTVAETGILKQA
jgi:hypothetical protein